eukprot:gnl/TRDRNA2_/TRDRNA2_85901_c0_seq1.p1 gnl/TRDRNA2_/TRDRNA2_85901_c0~~gnl/TRDRNA2_/TRDRNA2_85901_c0_seq1.p1  ORF type:complete len:274 (+),score=69.72 gnl/TRDRNA2_/TRDRNA2_85901_c0_seq1:9-830(+)
MGGLEGPILAEFSNLNALNQKTAASAYGAPQKAGGASAGGQDVAQQERLLRGEASYTGGGESYIDDQPQGAQFGVSHLMPKVSSTEERERLLRRLEMCAKAREESTKIMSVRFAQRDAVKNEMRRERLSHQQALAASQCERDERWSRKLQRSPFAVDLVAENQRIDEENRVRDHVEQRRQRLMAKRNREAHNAIFKRATAEADELDMLRTEKRMLLENERQLKALRDVEKSNARTAKILQERRKQQLSKQQGMLAQVVNTTSNSGANRTWPPG